MKVVNLKQAILQAWKERWSDYQWAINMKKFFPRGATWDILNLAGLKGSGEAGRSGTLRQVPFGLICFPTAEALLEQAMVGPSPNPLILSYLKYAISSQVNGPLPRSEALGVKSLGIMLAHIFEMNFNRSPLSFSFLSFFFCLRQALLCSLGWP